MQQRITTKQDLVIIGGGIMGLMTAYYASAFSRKVVLIDKRTVGNKEAASFSFTRSMHIDYLDPVYARLAYEAREMWFELQASAPESLVVPCGTLNIVKRTVSPRVEQTYAARTYEVARKLGYGTMKLSKSELAQRFPQFVAEAGYFDPRGGYFDLKGVLSWLLRILGERGVELVGEATVTEIADTPDQGVTIKTDHGDYTAKSVVIAAGAGTNAVLKLVAGNTLSLPIKYVKPQESKYYYPKPGELEQYLPDKLPTFAYLDVGIYGHPVFDRQRGSVKISYWRPPDFEPVAGEKITSVADFVRLCMPLLQDSRVKDVDDADNCAYDYVADDNFILGQLPGGRNIFVGTGWRGTGYKFAPLVGKVLAQLSVQNGTVYDISKFSLARFEKSSTAAKKNLATIEQ